MLHMLKGVVGMTCEGKGMHCKVVEHKGHNSLQCETTGGRSTC